jgi:hypothetical protein
MSRCEPIIGLKLDEESQDAIKRLNNKNSAGKLLAVVLSAGVFSSIFTKSNSAQASFNILQTDWELYFKAMQAVPVITRHAIEKEVEYMIIHYQYNDSYDEKHLKFWKGIYNGCK